MPDAGLNEVSEQHVKLKTMNLAGASCGSWGAAGPGDTFINFFENALWPA